MKRSQQPEYRIHPNGGGRVASTARVDATVFLGPGVVIEGKAKVLNDVRIVGEVIVSGNASIRNKVKIYGPPRVKETDIQASTIINGKARISGHASITGTSQVTGTSVIQGRVQIRDSEINGGTVRDDVQMCKSLVVVGGIVRGHAVVAFSGIAGIVSGSANLYRTAVRVNANVSGGTHRDTELKGDVRQTQLMVKGLPRDGSVTIAGREIVFELSANSWTRVVCPLKDWENGLKRFTDEADLTTKQAYKYTLAVTSLIVLSKPRPVPSAGARVTTPSLDNPHRI